MFLQLEGFYLNHRINPRQRYLYLGQQKLNDIHNLHSMHLGTILARIRFLLLDLHLRRLNRAVCRYVKTILHYFGPRRENGHTSS